VTYLLDVNVLIALMDPAHVHHDAAHQWFAQEAHKDWATCPMTENRVIRIISHPRYPNSPGSPVVIIDIVKRLRGLAGHVFWADSISLLDHRYVDPASLLTSQQVTDSYLLALAVAHGGRLATFDRRLVTKAVRDGAAALHVI
jgi:uncharacterized protein